MFSVFHVGRIFRLIWRYGFYKLVYIMLYVTLTVSDRLAHQVIYSFSFLSQVIENRFHSIWIYFKFLFRIHLKFLVRTFIHLCIWSQFRLFKWNCILSGVINSTSNAFDCSLHFVYLLKRRCAMQVICAITINYTHAVCFIVMSALNAVHWTPMEKSSIQQVYKMSVAKYLAWLDFTWLCN